MKLIVSCLHSNLRISVIWCMILLLFSLMACSKYESVGSEIHYEIKTTRNFEINDGKITKTAYTIEDLIINGHEIELVNKTTNTEKSFFINTKNYGPIKIVVHESHNRKSWTIKMLLTREQKEKIKELH